MNINLGIGRVRNITAENVFLKNRSLYEFVHAAKGKKYDAVYDFCDDYYGKKHDRKYFGQIITPINIQLYILQYFFYNLCKCLSH